MEAISGIAEPDGFDKMIETPWETFEEQVAAALAEGLALERPPPTGLVDVALACGMWELRPPAMTARDWLSELDPNVEIAGLPAVVREGLIGGQRGLAGRLHCGQGLVGRDDDAARGD